MSNSKLLNKHFKAIVAGALILPVIGLTIAMPGINGWRLARAAQFARAGESANDMSQATLDYRYASLLAPEKSQYTTDLAERYVRLDQPDAAIETLSRLPQNVSGNRRLEIMLASGQLQRGIDLASSMLAKQSSQATYLLKSKLLLEQNRPSEAVSAAESALGQGMGDTATQLQLGYCYLATGLGDKMTALMGSVTHSETRSRLEYARKGKYQLASELYASGLLASAERTVAAVEDVNSETARLAGTIGLVLYRYDSHGLQITADKLKAAVVADTANADLRELLKQAYETLGQKDNASKQAELITQLRNGTP